MIALSTDDLPRLIQAREQEAARLRAWAEVHRKIAAGHDECAERFEAELRALRSAAAEHSGRAA